MDLSASLPAGNGRLLAIGDIHGCLDQLRELLARVVPTPHDQLVFLGDYVDRGPDSAGVVEVLLTLRDQLPRTVFLRGNHEQMLLDVLAGGDPAIFLLNGGEQTIASYRNRGDGRRPLPTGTSITA
jgi:serine/threonine protein phosphatase 1